MHRNTLRQLVLPALLLMPATSVRMMVLVDLPLCMATTGSLAAFYMMAESAQGRSRTGALLKLPMLIAIGTGLAPHLSSAVWDGLRSMAGEFVRTPKQGNDKTRYKAAMKLPYVEAALALWSAAGVVASCYTGHYFAAPFSFLFMMGYGYVTVLLTREQIQRARPEIEVAPALESALLDSGRFETVPRVSDIAALRVSDVGLSDVPESGEIALEGAMESAATDEAVAA